VLVILGCFGVVLSQMMRIAQRHFLFWNKALNYRMTDCRTTKGESTMRGII